MFIRDILYMFCRILYINICVTTLSDVMSTPPKAHSKKSRSSEGETQTPENKHAKMADIVVVSGDLKTQLSVFIESVKEIKEGQDGMKRMVESKIDKLRSDVLSTIDEKIRNLINAFENQRQCDMNSIHTNISL